MALLTSSVEIRAGRSGVNTVWDNGSSEILQRGQILTWQAHVKAAKLKEWGVTAVVNFWPKADAELGALPLDWAWQLSCPNSEDTLKPHIHEAADAAAVYLRGTNRKVLVLCEAGKTRSMFFCVLLLHRLEGWTYAQSIEHAKRQVKGTALKGFMVDWCTRADKLEAKR